MKKKDSPNEKPIIIIGAGPAGLTAAYELSKLGYKVTVIECTDSVGGISKTINHNGNLIDIGGHRFFSKSEKVLKWWASFLSIAELPEHVEIEYRNQKMNLDNIIAEGKNNYMLLRSRKSRIYFHKRFFNYPLQVNYALIKNLGKKRTLRIARDLLKSKLRPIKPEKTLEDFYINRFGKELYKTFFKDYTKKVWGVTCDKISSDWGKQRIKTLGIRAIFWHSIKKVLFSKGTYGNKAERSLTEKFLYPIKGPGMMWETVMEKCIDNGVEFIYNARVHTINHEDKRAVSVNFQKNDMTFTLDCKAVISSMPLKYLLRSFSPTAAPKALAVSENLIYRDFMIVGLLFSELKFEPENNEFIKDNWLYIQDRGVNIGRLQIFNNWSPKMVSSDNFWVGAEFFCNQGDELWKLSNDEMIRLAVSELEEIGIADPSKYLDGRVVRCPKAYPSYSGVYSEINVLQDYLEEYENIYPVGRNGLHKYNNQDHSMLTAFKAVELIEYGNPSKKEIWNINADDEYHETIKNKSVKKKAPDKNKTVKNLITTNGS